MYNAGVHHRQSIRLSGWDYRNPGAYFVTVCSYERQLLFGHAAIRDAIQKAWQRSICHGQAPPPYEFVVMPNHVHGIVWRRRNPVGARHPSHQIASLRLDLSRERTTSDSRGASPLRPVEASMPRPPDRGSLGAIIGAFKSASAKRVNTIRRTPSQAVWQRGYYERIIRDEDELNAVRQYILDNPAKWALDPNNPSNL